MKKILAVLLAITLLFSFPIAAQAASVAKVSGVKVTATTTDSVSLKWKKASGAKGYLVYCSTNKTKGFKKVKTIKKGKTVKTTIKKLDASKTYYFKVRAYRGKTKGKFSKVVKAKTKAKPVTNKAGLTELKEGNTYYFDLTRDGKLDKITIKTVANYGDSSSAVATKDVYVNGVKKIRAEGYKGLVLYVFCNGKDSVIVDQFVSTGTSLSYYYYNAGTFTHKDLDVKFYGYFEHPGVIGNTFIAIQSLKAHWFNTFDSAMCFGKKEWPFEVYQQFNLTEGKLVKTTEYPTTRNKTTFTSNKDITTGKTVDSVSKADGVKVKKGEKFTIVNVYSNSNDEFYYRVKVGNSYGWFLGKSDIQLTAV